MAKEFFNIFVIINKTINTRIDFTKYVEELLKLKFIIAWFDVYFSFFIKIYFLYPFGISFITAFTL